MSTTFAIVTGASSGIGLELATICAQKGVDLLVAAGVLAEQHRRMAEPRSAEKANE